MEKNKPEQMELPLKFDAHPSVVFRLGEELISDGIQALLELVKNSYDADAGFAKVTIHTTEPNPVEDTDFPTAKGVVVIEDDGVGMDLKTIENGWLLISNLAKREMKEKGETSKRGRTPLGDKGLGRLGAQRLGRNLEIFTQTENAKEALHISFSWDDFLKAGKLSDVEVKHTRLSLRKKKGTRIVISNLKEMEFWRGDVSVKRLEQELSRMISPYKKIRDFFIDVEVDGKRLELAEISDKLRSIAQVRYKIDFDGECFKVLGKVKLDFFRPQNKKEFPEFEALIEGDNGETFLGFLLKQKQSVRFACRKPNEARWFI